MPEQVEGLDELMANFEAAIRAAMGQPVVQAGVAGAEIIGETANQLAPGPHNVIVVRVASESNALLFIGPDKEHWHYRFFETGTQAHYIMPTNKAALAGGALPHPLSKQLAVGGIAARPFLRPAIDQEGERVLGVMGKVFWDQIAGVLT